MAKEAVTLLFRAVQKDPALKQKLNTAANPDEFVAMAGVHGYHFTVKEWQDVTSFAVEEMESKMSEIPGI